jgi:LysR family hydrogen peroxide-inducible transcriptional activator
MRFEQLHYFETAARVGSLRRAAAELGVSQPTLTQQIQRLEEELNLVLLTRHPTGVALTEGGRALLPHVRRALLAEGGLLQEAGAITGLHKGRLRLGAIPVVGQLFLPEAVRSFQDTYPGVEFVVIESGSGSIRDGLASGALDMGILASWPEGGWSYDEFRTEELFSGVYTICVPPDHRMAGAKSVRVSDLAGESFVVVEQGQVLRAVFERIAAEVPVSIVYESNSGASARRTVDAGVGITIQSELSNWGPQRYTSVALRLDAPWSHTSVVLACRRDEQPTPAMLTFIQLIRARTERLGSAIGEQ